MSQSNDILASRETAEAPFLLIRVRGTQARMGEQLGALARMHGGHKAAIEFYARMGAKMIGSSMPPRIRPVAEAVANKVLGMAARRLVRERKRVFPAYAARAGAFLAAAGLPTRAGETSFAMDAFQNLIGSLGGHGILGNSALGVAAVPACSSLAVWGRASRDGTLLHARNFDFPGAGIWDEAPTIVFCDPDEGLRYGFVAMRGADAPGITCFNEAGVTLTVHSRFHADVRSRGPGIVDLGHEIIRRSVRLEDAVAIARRLGASSSWALVVSSAAERSAVLIEVAGQNVAVTDPGTDAHLGTANLYHARSLKEREVRPSLAFEINCRARSQRLERAVREADAGLSADDLEKLLGDYGREKSSDADAGATRLAGDCLVSPMTVQSIVAEPERRRMRVSIGRAPACFGPYVPVDWLWDGPVGASPVSPPETNPGGIACDGRTLTGDERAIVREYSALFSLNLLGGEDAKVTSRLDALVARVPAEPHFRALAAFFAMRDGSLDQAAAHLEEALRNESGESRIGRLRLWSIRVASARGRAADVKRHYDALSSLAGSENVPVRAIAEAEMRRPLTKAQLRRVVPDLNLVDAAIAGVAY